MKSKGYAAQSATTALKPFTFERREPGPDDVAFDVEYCGICHSDIHSARNEWGHAIYPMVPGHELIGKVTAVGKAVENFKPGDPVGVGCLVDSCRTCQSCQQGLENYCEMGMTFTYNSPSKDSNHPTYGGYSNNFVVDKRFLLKIPKNIYGPGAAPLLCAGITTYSPLKYVGIKKADKIAVLGLGGLGHMAVKLAASLGAQVTVMSRSLYKKEDAKRLGAHHFILTSDEKSMTAATNHFDYILDTVSAKHDLNQALGCLKREGTLILVGASDKPIDLEVFSVIFNRRKILGSLIGGLPQTQEMLNHCSKNNITSDFELIKPNQINEAYDRVVAGKVKYRFVIDCKSF